MVCISILLFFFWCITSIRNYVQNMLLHFLKKKASYSRSLNTIDNHPADHGLAGAAFFFLLSTDMDIRAPWTDLAGWLAAGRRFPWLFAAAALYSYFTALSPFYRVLSSLRVFPVAQSFFIWCARGGGGCFQAPRWAPGAFSLEFWWWGKAHPPPPPCPFFAGGGALEMA